MRSQEIGLVTLDSSTELDPVRLAIAAMRAKRSVGNSISRVAVSRKLVRQRPSRSKRFYYAARCVSDPTSSLPQTTEVVRRPRFRLSLNGRRLQSDTTTSPSPPPTIEVPPSSPPSPPPSPPFPPPPESSLYGDPHLHFAHGGVADFRGKNGTFFVLHTFPGLQFAARTMDTTFLLPRPQLVHGSFFTDASWIVRGRSGDRSFLVRAAASSIGFDVYDAKSPTNLTLLGSQHSPWRSWSLDGVEVSVKHSTMFVRAHGWRMECTRKPIYNHVSGPSKWRFDVSIKLEGHIGRCYPHGLLGQSWDGDEVGIDGNTDDYTFREEEPIIVTKAQAEGAIEGEYSHYAISNDRSTSFWYSRFSSSGDCPPRDTSKLSGRRVYAGTHDASSSERVEE